MLRPAAILLLLVMIIFCFFFFFSRYQKSSPVQFSSMSIRSPDHRVETQFNDWKNCMLKIISIYESDAEGFWSHFMEGVDLCKKLPFMSDLAIHYYPNTGETKGHIVPLQNTPRIIVTLGVGHETMAEEALIKVLPKGSVFYGADPITEVNRDLYMRFGTFFPFAIGSKSKISRASVLINDSYVDRNVVHIEFVYFLSVLIGHKVYDNILMDAEGAEYELFPYFYRDGDLDRNGITVCQFNVEVHGPVAAQKEMLSKFVFQILRDNRYAFFRAGQETQLYFFNFSDSECVSRYIVGRSS